MDFREKRHDFTLNISEQVIAQIAQLVVSDVEGVAQVVEPPKSFRRWLLPKTTHQLVQITPLSDSVEISIFVLLHNGYRIKEVAEQVQNCVKQAVQDLTGNTVSKVNVSIEGIAA